MIWFGQRSQSISQFSQSRCLLDRDAPVASGTVMLQYTHRISDRPVNLLRYAVRDPAPAGLAIRVDPDGSVHVSIRQAGVDALYCLPMRPPQPGETVLLRFAWDTRSGRGYLSVSLPATDGHTLVEIETTVAPSLRDLHRLIADQTRVPMAQNVVFLAVSDQIAPAGPMPGLDGCSWVETPNGPKQIKTLRSGQIIIAGDGTAVQVRWVGSVTLPSLGIFKPMKLRAPYYGAIQDMILSGNQRLILRGSEVEYLFAQTEVAVALRDLLDENVVTTPAGLPEVRYFQMMVDRPVPLRVGGALVPDFDVSSLIFSPDLARRSVLAGLPSEMIPRNVSVPPHCLRSYEARTLKWMRAA